MIKKKTYLLKSAAGAFNNHDVRMTPMTFRIKFLNIFHRHPSQRQGIIRFNLKKKYPKKQCYPPLLTSKAVESSAPNIKALDKEISSLIRSSLKHKNKPLSNKKHSNIQIFLDKRSKMYHIDLKSNLKVVLKWKKKQKNKNKRKKKVCLIPSKPLFMPFCLPC